MQKTGYVYIMCNRSNTTLYTGVTSDLKKRIWEHKEKIAPGFTNKYHINKLVYYEVLDTIEQAIAREKQIKSGSRKKKINLIEGINKQWADLFESLD